MQNISWRILILPNMEQTQVFNAVNFNLIDGGYGGGTALATALVHDAGRVLVPL